MQKLIALSFTFLFLATTSLDAAKMCDKPARPTTDYVKKSVIYQILFRAFSPEGTLKAAEAKLPKLTELGVDILYLTPVTVSDDDPDPSGWSPRQRASKMNNPRNPYRMKDYYHVDPEYGTDQDLKDFVAAAHKLDMRVMLDIVFFHCGPNAVFLKENPDFVVRDKDGKIAKGRWGFPMVNHDNPKLREYLQKNLEYWVTDFGFDGFRMDVADGIPMSFWDEARARLEKIQPEIVMLAGAYGEYDGQLNAFEIDYSFPWCNLFLEVYDGKQPASSFRKTWESSISDYPRGARLLRFSSSHDVANDSYDNRPDKRWGTEIVDAGLVLNFTIDGVPMLYNGQEIADIARNSIYGRLPINWSTADTPGGKVRFALCKELCKLRHTEKALSHGQVVWLDNNVSDDVVSFLRADGDEQVLVLVNMTKKDVTVEVEMPPASQDEFQTLLTRDAQAIATDGQKQVFSIKGCGYFVAKQK